MEILLQAFELLQETRGDIELVIGGAYEGVAGGSVYQQLKDYIGERKNPISLARCIETVLSSPENIGPRSAQLKKCMVRKCFLTNV